MEEVEFGVVRTYYFMLDVIIATIVLKVVFFLSLVLVVLVISITITIATMITFNNSFVVVNVVVAAVSTMVSVISVKEACFSYFRPKVPYPNYFALF